jgi:hypothetical protein
MLDDLRSSANEGFPEEEPTTVYTPVRYETKKNFLGMTAPQRFIISLLLLIAVVILGTFCLLITGKIVIP